MKNNPNLSTNLDEKKHLR